MRASKPLSNGSRYFTKTHGNGLNNTSSKGFDPIVQKMHNLKVPWPF